MSEQLALFAARRLSSAPVARATDEWYTPPRYIALARTVLGAIDLDPASSEVAQQVVGAGRYYTPEHDGLALPWHGRVWLNPPYSNPAPWVERLVREYQHGRVTGAILLVYTATDTAWFEPLWDCPICFVRGRIQFDNRPGKSNPRGSVFVYLGQQRNRFAEVFESVGAVMERMGAQGALGGAR